MQIFQNAENLSPNFAEQRRTLRTRQADRLDILTAASETEEIWPEWLCERLLERERVSS